MHGSNFKTCIHLHWKRFIASTRFATALKDFFGLASSGTSCFCFLASGSVALSSSCVSTVLGVAVGSVLSLELIFANISRLKRSKLALQYDWVQPRFAAEFLLYNTIFLNYYNCQAIHFDLSL